MLEPMIRRRLPLVTCFGFSENFSASSHHAVFYCDRIFLEMFFEIKLSGNNGTLQGTNISPKKWHFEDDFPNFPFGGICIHSLEGSKLVPWNKRGERGGANGSIRFSPEIGMGANNGFFSASQKNPSVVIADRSLFCYIFCSSN